MADVTLSSRTIIRPYRSRAGAPRLLTLDASTAVSTALIKVGQVVQFDATGSAAHRVVRASTGTPVLSTTLVGVAASDDTSDGSTTGLGDGKRPITIWAADPQTEFLFPTKSVTASTLVNTQRALAFDSTLGIHFCDAGNSSAGDARIVITEVPNAGDTNGAVVGRFVTSAVAAFIRPI